MKLRYLDGEPLPSEPLNRIYGGKANQRKGSISNSVIQGDDRLDH